MFSTPKVYSKAPQQLLINYAINIKYSKIRSSLNVNK